MPHCQTCGTFVSPDFARVFGNNDLEVFRCLDCATYGELVEGEAAIATQ